MELKLFDNWRTAWAVYADNMEEYMPDPDEAAFMDKYLGDGPVRVWCPEDAMDLDCGYPDSPGMVGPAIAGLRADKVALGEHNDFAAHANGVYMVLGTGAMAGGVHMAYIKA
jgi:hypothetical protein